MVQEEYIEEALINQNYELIINYINRLRDDWMRNAKLYSLASKIGEIENTDSFEEIINMIDLYSDSNTILNRFFVIMIIEEKYNKASIIFNYLNILKNIFDFSKYKSSYWTDMEYKYKLDKFIFKYYYKYNFVLRDKIKIFI